MLKVKVIRIEKQIRVIFGENIIENLARQSGFVKRQRTFTTTGFMASLLYSLGTRKAETIADLHRYFNLQNNISINYKPYYEKLDTKAFHEIMLNYSSPC